MGSDDANIFIKKKVSLMNDEVAFRCRKSRRAILGNEICTRDGIAYIGAPSIGNGKVFKITYISKIFDLFLNVDFRDNEFQNDSVNISLQSSY